LATSTALALMLAVPAVAQQSAMFVLRSGEQVSGELVDMGASGFQVRVGGSSRQIATGDVAVIDFSGSTSFPDSEVNQIQAGKHVIVLSNGQVVSGNLFDIGGTPPKRISVHTDTGNRDFRSTEVRRIYLARPGGARAATPAAPGSSTVPGTGGQIRVPANQRWTDTGVTVRRGDRVTFNASGQIQFSTSPSDTATSVGTSSGKRPSGPLANVPVGALLGRVGPVAVFAIGNQTALEMPADGRLFLGVNDDNVADNQGEFTVEVRPDPTSATRRR
jgi:hypothetical protein